MEADRGILRGADRGILGVMGAIKPKEETKKGSKR
jgi:hypothetical protein